MVLIITALTTVSSFVKPTANAYVLNVFGLQLLYVLRMEMKQYVQNQYIYIGSIYIGIYMYSRYI